jgi:cAMP-dependent protein kinase regulator
VEQRSPTADELAGVPLLANLPADALVSLAERMERRELEPGEAVLREGEEGHHFYVVLTGMLAVHRQDVGQRRVLMPGEYFGEVALVEGIPRTATVSAVAASTVASCDETGFAELVGPLFWAG